MLWRDLGRGWFQGGLSAGDQKATRQQAWRFARTGMACPVTVDMARDIYKMADPGDPKPGLF